MTTIAIPRTDPSDRLYTVRREHNQGEFLTEPADQGFAAASSVQVAFEPAQDYAELLGIAPDDEMCVRDRVLRAGNTPVQLAVSRLPRSITHGTSLEAVDTGPGGIYARIEERGHRLTRFDEIVTGGAVLAHERALLGEDVGFVLRIRRTALADNVVVEVNDIVLSADLYALHSSFPAQ